MKVIALTGGIGSGKSVVSAVLRVMGYDVYDCDSRAKLLMAQSTKIKDALIDAFGAGAVVEGQIDRAYISRAVFGRPEALKCLNAIVHPAVRNDLEQWLAQCSMEYAFVETAILQSSNFKDLISAEWHVTASVELRVARVAKRNGLSREDVMRRISSQSAELPGSEARIIDNSGNKAILPQVQELLSQLAK